jgi:hypothetical protein
VSTYTPTAEDLETLSALFDVCQYATVPDGEWRDYCAGMADLYDRLYKALVEGEPWPPVWQRMALLTSRDWWAREAEDLDR